MVYLVNGLSKDNICKPDRFSLQFVKKTFVNQNG